MLEAYIREKLKEKDILLMSHMVLGYPSFETSMEMVAAMVSAGVDLMELQIPFSEPMADGPVILRANQQALAGGATVRKCMEFAGKVTRSFDIPFLFMTYYNIVFKYGAERFAAAMATHGLRGAIIADLPPEESGEYLNAMERHKMAPIYIFSPTTAPERMRTIASVGKGFIYCVARKGVTGAETTFSDDLSAYLARCRDATTLPIAVGFGIKNQTEIDFLRGKAEVAVIGSEMIRRMEQEGVSGVKPFLESLRQNLF
jgi:tryptophan synthase alpha chain